MNDAQKIAVEFHAAINGQSLDELSSLMTANHVFVDTALNSIDGREASLDAWRSFFAMFPDYRNYVEIFAASDEEVMMAGRSMCSVEQLKGPFLWRARIVDAKVLEWQIYADTAENRRLLKL